MSGCLRRLGCLVLIVAVALGWLTRDWWYPRLFGGGAATTGGAAASSDVVWEPLTPQGAARARAAVASLGQPRSPNAAVIRPGDVAAYVFTGISKQLPPSAQDVRAAAIGDRLYVKALVNLADFGGQKVLGPLAGFLNERDTVQFGGNFEIVRPGLAQYHVREIRLHELKVPARLIPRLLAQNRRGARPEGVADDALPLLVPEYVSDVQVAGGKVTLYKRAGGAGT